MGVRERVQRAIESPVAEAEKLLADAPHAKRTERLTILMNGWFRGIAGALDELAIELEALQAAGRAEPPAPPPPPAARAEEPEHHVEQDAGQREHDERDPTLAELAERARTSREQTEALREETPEA